MNDSTENEAEDTFESALQRYGMEFDQPLQDSLQSYVELMWKMNESVNLTRHTTWDLFVGRDLRDCLQLAHLIQPDETVLDLGSGNGIPGIPLAIIRPDVEVSLAESVGKRAKVLDEMVSELNLSVPVYATRGENLLEDFRFTSIVSRAVGSLMKFCRWIEPHWSGVDRLLLVKGPRWVEERAEARHFGVLKNLDLRVVATYPLGLPSDSPLSPALKDEAAETDDLPHDEIGAEEESQEGEGQEGEGQEGEGQEGEGQQGEGQEGEGQGVILQLSRKGRFA